ncbi:MAG: hypothetical protein WCE21_03840 [Candidatus Babeliales bacterium]
MMPLMYTIYGWVSNLDAAQFKKWSASFFGITTLLLLALFYWYYHATTHLSSKMVLINKQRVQTRELLERFEVVKKQKAEVNTLLEQDRDFKIGGYFSTIIDTLHMRANKTRDPATSSIQLDNGYTEIQLYASFSQVNMQKIAELLDTIEQNPRIYVKELEIYKPGTEQSVNFNVMIATLQAQGETP